MFGTDLKFFCALILGQEEHNNFAEWAFGPEYETTYYEDIPDRWNELHPDLPKFDKTGNARTDILQMIHLWIDYRYKKLPNI
jgi:hypothetical protein